MSVEAMDRVCLQTGSTSEWRRQYTLVDSRMCQVCGSKYGFCEHTEGLREERTAILLAPESGKIADRCALRKGKFTRPERGKAVTLRSYGFSIPEIADLMSKTQDGVRQALTVADREAGNG